MSIKWLNTPFEDVIQAAINIRGDINCEIVFNPELYNEDNIYGATHFREDGSVLIELDTNMQMSSLLETLSHELAHVIAGKEAEHNEKWEKIFEDIYAEYNRYCMSKYGGDL